jgi:precorrin-6Y C5,15-methyltransferase (decarboxylating)
MLTVVGIGADGWPGLGDGSRAAIDEARLIVGSERQLALLPTTVGADRRPWPTPLQPLADELAAGAHGDAVVLASGDPLLHGIAASLIAAAGVDAVRVLPHPSAFALACARMGWSQPGVELVSAVGRAPEAVIRALQPGRRIVAYATGHDGAATLARVLDDHGFGTSAFTILEQLGGAGERRTDRTAQAALTHVADSLHVVAIEVAAGPGHARTPGLPDSAFGGDGQLTKRHVRAITVATLAPLPGELLWDVGAGSGTIGIEWLRAESTARAIAIESRADRAATIVANARSLGVPHLEVVHGAAPDALPAQRPDVIFIGGGITAPGLLDACWKALRAGGRLVANTVTLEGEQVVQQAQETYGGGLTRIDIAHAEPVGAFRGWRAQMTVVQWAVTKEPR